MMQVAGRRLSSRGRRWALYLAGLAIFGFAVASLALTVLKVAPRSGEISLLGQPARVTLFMEPDPPKTGPIPVRVEITDVNGLPIRVDEVVVRYGMESQPPRERAAVPGASLGLYRAQIEFANVGRAWVEVLIRRGNTRGQLTFRIEVRPNI